MTIDKIQDGRLAEVCALWLFSSLFVHIKFEGMFNYHVHLSRCLFPAALLHYSVYLITVFDYVLHNTNSVFRQSPHFIFHVKVYYTYRFI